MKNICIIIPSLNPDERLGGVVSSLVSEGFNDIILVDDGSKEENKKYFPTGDGITLITHPTNFGKGTALKTALSYLTKHRQDITGAVTCDGDGQHLSSDVKRVAEEMKKTGNFVLGVRDFSLPNVPPKSRIGNRLSCFALMLCSGSKFSDTQTGLRGIPSELFTDMIQIDGARFEYETNVLLALRSIGAKHSEVKIETVYLDENKGTHFHPIKDTVRIFSLIIKYILSSAISFITDLVIFGILTKLCGIGVILSTIAARAISSIVNFIFNKKVVFNSSVSLPKAIIKYYCLAIPVMLISAFGVKGIAYGLGLEESSIIVTLIKAVVDCILFVANYKIQKKWIFGKKNNIQKDSLKNHSSTSYKDSKKSEKGFISKSDRSKKDEGEIKKSRLTLGKITGRFFLCFFTVFFCIIIAVYSSLFVVVNSGCEPLRNKLVLSAMQASATKWLPGLFMSQKTVENIVADSHKVTTYVISMDNYTPGESVDEDKWANAVDGMIFEEIREESFTGYVLLVKDASRLFVGTSSDYSNPETKGINIFAMAEKEDAVAIINAGEFSDIGGQGTGNTPLGITYSKGNCVWNDSYKRTFIGFDKDNKLIVTETMTKQIAEQLGIRDGVSFQNGNVLITNTDNNITLHKADANTGAAQRTAIGQTADGTVILLVTDGRSASSIGANRNDIIDVLLSYGAVTAGMLDGGSSSLMYYEDYYTKFDYDTEKLDQYQSKGIVNRYKAFTPPRRMPTYFCVRKETT